MRDAARRQRVAMMVLVDEESAGFARMRGAQATPYVLHAVCQPALCQTSTPTGQ